MSKEEDEKKAIFEEAFQHTFKIEDISDVDKVSNEIVKIIEKPTQEQLAEEAVLNPIDEWNEVEKAMTGRLATRFLNTMDGLGDREFIRIYMKAIEYFKPKVTRTEPTVPVVENNTLNVNIMVRNEETGEVEQLITEEK